MTNLGTLGGTYSAAVGINSHGEIAGGSGTAAGTSHAFLWERGQMIDLGPSGAAAINDHGDVVGKKRVCRTAVTCHPVDPRPSGGSVMHPVPFRSADARPLEQVRRRIGWCEGCDCLAVSRIRRSGQRS